MSYEHIFDQIEVAAEPFALCELQGRCSLDLNGLEGATLHYIIAGTGEIVVHGRSPFLVGRGTLALVPTLQPHVLRCFGGPDNPVPDCHPAELDLAYHLRQADDPSGGRLLALCSRITVAIRGTSGLVNLVREPMVEDIPAESAMLRALETLLQELSSPTLGSRAMIRALMLQCIIHLLRSRLLAGDSALRWMAALVDEKLWVALNQMLEMPGKLHTVESLADAVGMSRSTFASRFSTAYGSGPMELLRDLRINQAAFQLARSDLPVKRIAEMVGFQSRSAFSRAFADKTGTSPGQYRANAR